jgi:glutamate formiminotransferase/formiminotetrahydrofolate cyclodeaminase
LYRIFDESEKFANEFGARVTGSEIVGMIPLDALTQAGKYYLKKQELSTGVSENELVRVAVQTLGLNEVSPFIPEERIIEYKLRKKGYLASLDLYGFADELASDSPAPGGGSVAALNGSLSAALSSMVANLTVKKKKYKDVKKNMIKIAEEGQKIKDFLLLMVDKDTEAFNKIMDAFSLPKKSEEEIKERKSKIEEATKEATLIPFEVLKQCEKLTELALYVSEFGNVNSASDGGVAGLTAVAAAKGAFYNVIINLEGIEDESFKKDISLKAKNILEIVEKKGKSIEDILKKILKY